MLYSLGRVGAARLTTVENTGLTAFLLYPVYIAYSCLAADCDSKQCFASNNCPILIIMLKSIYTVLDRNRRPLRDRHCVLMAEKDIAFIRIPHAASMLLRHPLEHIVRESRGAPTAVSVKNPGGWIEGTKLVSPRELLYRQTPAFSFAIIRHPGHRLAACYRRQIAERDSVSDAWKLRGFRSGMKFEEFVQRACTIGDTRADNHTRSQTSLLCHKGNMIPEMLIRAERLATDWEDLRSLLSQTRLADVGPYPEIDEASALEDAMRYNALPQDAKRRIHSRYLEDFLRFYDNAYTGDKNTFSLLPLA
ncbi:sulfotransferase family 2 domain-containing protein [Rhizobiales bacterium]|uniref:sulfotransferase family 2 domain-containing protein n=1 Tax=Hongsoonwoonella zoysiae TaxID=2821844 RepID=UPI00156114F6|nr:sulfotransferase family 2 domain-containing protein [Hongsoonwoonella zoysiae]NRG18882.1 sulfotransferase family 2 domain-containing protein [Hongsoonwoonella zoysiae]